VTVWAAVQPLRGRKFFESAALQTDYTTRFIIRYRRGIHPELRIVYANKTYDVKGVIDPEERHREIHLICEEGNGRWLK
jgi:SPP1 family predicted phage head-tail adaptor